MPATSRHDHWEAVFRTKREDEVSWFQEIPTASLELIRACGPTPETAIIDIGGGESRLVDCLIDAGHRSVTVLDISEAALSAAKARLGDLSRRASWIVADITSWQPDRTYDIWHDRATFHFLTEPQERSAYVARLLEALRPGGSAIIGTFAPDGPERCSGLPVVRYDAASLARALGDAFELVETRRDLHRTPTGAAQSFLFSRLRRRTGAGP